MAREGLINMSRRLLCTLGKMDIPIIQEQPYFKVDLFQSNILLIGSAGSGKSNFLKVLIAEIHNKLKSTDLIEQIYVLDSADSLKECQAMPFVCAHYDFSNEEYIKRVFYQIEKQYSENVRALNGSQFSNDTVDSKIPHTTLIIDNINSFLDIKYNEKYMEVLLRLARDGQTKGISLIITGSSTRNITTILSYFSQKIALNLSSEEYLNIFSKKAVSSRNIVGRGYGNVTYDSSSKVRTYPQNLPYELQIFHMDVSSAFEIEENRCPKKLTRFPLVLKESDYHQYISSLGAVETDDYEADANDVVIGVEYTKCQAVKTRFATSKVLAIYGKRNDEKPLIWRRLFKKFHNNGYEFIMIDDGRSKLKELKEEMGVIDSNYFYKRKPIEREGTEKITISVLLQFIDYIQENLMNIKGERRSFNTTQEVLSTVMTKEHYNSIPRNEGRTKKKCVFVLQSKEFFSNTVQANVFWGDIFPRMITYAEENDWYFFLTDTQRIPNVDLQNHFNQYINTAILLDDIAEFVADRGRRSVFGEMDVKELKEQYGLCEENDAYFYQLDSAELWKIKCIREDV